MINQATGLINQYFSSYNNSSSLTIEKELNESNIFQREINFSIQKVINFSMIENKQQSKLTNILYVPELYPANKEKVNIENFNSEEYNLYREKAKKIQAITDKIKKSLINNNSTENNHNIKSKYFYTKKNIIKKLIFDFQTNNEIKVLKNNKVVYINKNILNKKSAARGIKKIKKINFIVRKKRSSKYRGVSKNGNKWQVLMMINNTKYFIGNYPSEELAARIYDIQAIKARGIKARTNFVYDTNQIKKIYNKTINIKCNDISEIMAQLNN